MGFKMYVFKTKTSDIKQNTTTPDFYLVKRCFCLIFKLDNVFQLICLHE